jgi:hypothetical protein
MELFPIFLLSWLFLGWLGGGIFSYLDVKLAGHELTVTDVLLGVVIVGAVLGPIIFFMILKDIRTFYPTFRNPRGE